MSTPSQGREKGLCDVWNKICFFLHYWKVLCSRIGAPVHQTTLSFKNLCWNSKYRSSKIKRHKYKTQPVIQLVPHSLTAVIVLLCYMYSCGHVASYPALFLWLTSRFLINMQKRFPLTLEQTTLLKAVCIRIYH